MPAENCPAMFVTGTDTGVGKTLVAAALARHFCTEGLKVGVMKPIETGVEQSCQTRRGCHTAALGAALDGRRQTDRPLSLSQPLAPCQAPTAGRRLIDIDKIVDACQIAPGKDMLLD